MAPQDNLLPLLSAFFPSYSPDPHSHAPHPQSIPAQHKRNPDVALNSRSKISSYSSSSSSSSTSNGQLTSYCSNSCTEREINDSKPCACGTIELVSDTKFRDRVCRNTSSSTPYSAGVRLIQSRVQSPGNSVYRMSSNGGCVQETITELSAMVIMSSSTTTCRRCWAASAPSSSSDSQSSPSSSSPPSPPPPSPLVQPVPPSSSSPSTSSSSATFPPSTFTHDEATQKPKKIIPQTEKGFRSITHFTSLFSPLRISHAYTQSGRWAAVALFLLLHLLAHTTPTTAQVIGVAMSCHQEGQAVKVPREVERDNPCISCSCQNHIVVCNKKKCPSLEGCYWKLADTRKLCCQVCKGCEHNGLSYKHGASWTDGCHHYDCQSGVLTVSQTQCHLPCYSQLALPDHKKCCSRCPGCWFEGRRVSEGQEVASRDDPCVRCVCSGGSLSCEKRACPVLSCPASKQNLSQDGCCMTCYGSRELIPPPGGRCFLNGHLYATGMQRTVDPCTTCTCHQGYITCQRRTCPVLNCSLEYQMTVENECCPVCSAAAQLESVCHVPGMVRKDGEEWHVDKCTSCTCNDGEVTCRMLPCEYYNKPCPPGYKRVETEAECCPRCEEAPGVCVVFGDPHYRTFDGLLFNFQGACKYTLARARKGPTIFNLKVNNDARRSSHFSWTKSLALKLPGVKVNLGQKLRTRINNKRVKPPLELAGVLNLTREGLALTLTTPSGLRVLWDGASYVEVEVPVEMQGLTSGLCGNFNKNITDDLMTADGAMVDIPDQMAMSWSTGHVRICSRRMKEQEKATQEMNALEGGVGRTRAQRSCPVSRSERLTQCALLNSTVFEACHSAAPIDKFYESCVLDMCECKTTRRCECDTLQAYARQCQRLGIPILQWRNQSKCGGLECPIGAEYMECAPPCRPTCRNPSPNPNCYTRRCRAGCYCPPPSVLHRGACIPVQDCPKRGKKQKRRHRNR